MRGGRSECSEHKKYIVHTYDLLVPYIYGILIH